MSAGKGAVKYDLNAGMELDSALGQLISRLDAFLGQRERDRRSLLGPTPCDSWSGKKRDRFDTEFRKEQAELHALRELAVRQRAAVQDANNNAAKAIYLEPHGN